MVPTVASMACLCAWPLCSQWCLHLPVWPVCVHGPCVADGAYTCQYGLFVCMALVRLYGAYSCQYGLFVCMALVCLYGAYSCQCGLFSVSAP